MWYRRLGRTELMISEVSLGGSPPPEVAVFRAAIDRGVNYVDTSSTYSNGGSERTIAQAVKGVRDRFHITTKVHPNAASTKESLIAEAEGSLERLGTDYLDVLMIHGVGSADVALGDVCLETFAELQQQGKIRFTGVSCHRDPVNVLPPIIESGKYDVLDVAYNVYSSRYREPHEDYLGASGLEGVVRKAREHDVGFIAMKPMAGGNCQDLAKWQGEGISLAQAKIKWILDNPYLTALLTEALTYDWLEEDLAVVGQPFTQAERQALRRYVDDTSSEVCRMCGTCQKACPQGVAVPSILRYAAYYRGYGERKAARAQYGALPTSGRAAACVGCGSCEAGCPYGVAVRRKLREAASVLA